MMTCVEAYQTLCEHIDTTTSDAARESLFILSQFKDIFKDTDDLLNDPTIITICKNLPHLHFARNTPLDTKPVVTIKNEYYRRTGKQLPESICNMAYYHTLRHSTDIIDAENPQHQTNGGTSK